MKLRFSRVSRAAKKWRLVPAMRCRRACWFKFRRRLVRNRPRTQSRRLNDVPAGWQRGHSAGRRCDFSWRTGEAAIRAQSRAADLFAGGKRLDRMDQTSLPAAAGLAPELPEFRPDIRADARRAALSVAILRDRPDAR